MRNVLLVAAALAAVSYLTPASADVYDTCHRFFENHPSDTSEQFCNNLQDEADGQAEDERADQQNRDEDNSD
jgi:hypothetical protein